MDEIKFFVDGECYLSQELPATVCCLIRGRFLT